jgi:hypothetical protein
VNAFNGSNGGYENSDGFVINKAALINGTLTVTVFRNLLDPKTLIGPITPQGVDVFDSNSTHGYFVGVSGENSLALNVISHPGGTPSISKTILIPIPTITSPLDVPHRGNMGGANGYLDSTDTRMSHSHVRDGLLYTSHNIGVDPMGNSSSSSNDLATGSRFYEINIANPLAPKIIQSGTLFGPGTNFLQRQFYFAPSVMTNGLHNLVLGSSTAGQPFFINAAISQHFLTYCPNVLTPATIYTNSTTSYNPPNDPGGAGGRKWGNYSTVSIDPLDNMTMWTIQEYANATDSWGAQVVRVLAPAPPSFVVSPNAIPVGTTAALTIVGNGINGSAFYDPSADFPNHLKVLISGCVIDSITIVNPTQLLVNVFAVTAGSKVIIVTNPDGQSSTGLSSFTVCP